MARLPYLEADQVAPEYRDMLKRNTNLHKLLVNSPDMARAFNGIGGYIRFKSKLDPRLRELAILQVGWMEKSEYEFTHHVKIGREFGVTDDDIVALMAETGGSRLAVLGWAYKGWPPTDDMRGTPIATMMPVFDEAGISVVGHDPLVANDVIRAYGGQPSDIASAFSGADAVLVITDHPQYRALDIGSLLSGSEVRLVFDSWRILDEATVRSHGARYAGLGYEPSTTQACLEGARS